MLDIKFIRENPQKVKEGARKKQIKVDVDKLLKLDKQRRQLLQKIESLRAKQKKTGGKITKTKIKDLKKIKDEIKKLEPQLKKIDRELEDLMISIPNLPLDEVPEGKNEKENVVVREVGKKPKFSFKLKDYLEIAQNLDLIDTERAAKVSGTRFGYLKREVALLEFALINLALDILRKQNFVPIIPPVMLKEKMARGTGYFEAADKEEAYFLPQDNLYLAGTSEQPLIAMHADEILDQMELPRRYVGFSTCFRREAGSYGQDTKGILRVHQFDKVEMVSFCRSEDSKKEHLFLLEMEEKLMKLLKIPYRVVQMCTGDLGFPAAAKYDIEAWLPSQNCYRETHSTSNCTDFQARRLNIRYRDKKETRFVHTLNGTAFSQRPILAIIENYQKKDGSVEIPQVLRKYMGGLKEIKR